MLCLLKIKKPDFESGFFIFSCDFILEKYDLDETIFIFNFKWNDHN